MRDRFSESVAEHAAKLPALPNFILTATGSMTVDVADVSDSVLRAIGRRWSKALLAHAASRRKARTHSTASRTSKGRHREGR